jgi:hypothetical protein
MRKIELEVLNCDVCPLRKYDGDYGMSHDAGWDCGHPNGGFRIANEGGYNVIQSCGDSVCRRMAKFFPEGCPLEEATDEN